MQANGSLAGCSPAQPKQEKFLESLTGNGVTFDSKNATKGVQGNSLPNFSETDVAARPSISQVSTVYCCASSNNEFDCPEEDTQGSITSSVS